jgi:hypothetical protein
MVSAFNVSDAAEKDRLNNDSSFADLSGTPYSEQQRYRYYENDGEGSFGAGADGRFEMKEQQQPLRVGEAV